MDNFTVKDLYLAGFIYASGVPFVGTKREGRVCWFEFENREKCVDLQKMFLSREGIVVGKDYSDALKTLKGVIFDFTS